MISMYFKGIYFFAKCLTFIEKKKSQFTFDVKMKISYECRLNEDAREIVSIFHKT